MSEKQGPLNEFVQKQKYNYDLSGIVYLHYVNIHNKHIQVVGNIVCGYCLCTK